MILFMAWILRLFWVLWAMFAAQAAENAGKSIDQDLLREGRPPMGSFSWAAGFVMSWIGLMCPVWFSFYAVFHYAPSILGYAQ